MYLTSNKYFMDLQYLCALFQLMFRFVFINLGCNIEIFFARTHTDTSKKSGFFAALLLHQRRHRSVISLAIICLRFNVLLIFLYTFIFFHFFLGINWSTVSSVSKPNYLNTLSRHCFLAAQLGYSEKKGYIRVVWE
jgi:hypothetical protein